MTTVKMRHVNVGRHFVAHVKWITLYVAKFSTICLTTDLPQVTANAQYDFGLKHIYETSNAVKF